MTRWVMNKEQHASHVIEVIANYFLAQRVKPSDDVDAYESSLADHHAVVVAAMKTKQRADQESVDALFAAIEQLATHYHTH
jgi:nickel superoxide dismutase